MDESHNVSAGSDSLNNTSTAESLNGTFTLEKPTLGVENTPKLTLPIRRRQESASVATVHNRVTRTPASTKKLSRHAPYGETRTPKVKHTSPSTCCFSERPVGTRKTTATLTCVAKARAFDLHSVYLQQLSPDTSREQSASAQLLNSTQSRRPASSLIARYAMPPQYQDSCSSKNATDSAVCKQLITEFLAEEQDAQGKVQASETQVDTPTVCMPDLITSAVPKASTDAEKSSPLPCDADDCQGKPKKPYFTDSCENLCSVQRPRAVKLATRNTNMRQLTAELNDSAMMNYDEEIMEHLGNAQRGVRTASPLRSTLTLGCSPQRCVSVNPLPPKGCENVRFAPVVLETAYAFASPVGARSAYFPMLERCTNPVSNVLEFGDETHFIPVSTPSRDDLAS